MAVTIIVIGCLFQTAGAQTVEFVPKGLSLTSFEFSRTTYNKFLTSNSKTASVFDVYRQRNGIDESAVTGSVDHEKSSIRLLFQYGLFDTFNLGVSIPYLNNQRKSDINLLDSGQSEFAESIGDASSSGMGDIEIQGLWRLFYTDIADLQLGLSLNGDNAPYNGDNHDKMALGSGSKEMSIFLRGYRYSIHSSLMLAFEVEYMFVEENTVKVTDGQEVTKSQENSSMAKMEVSANSDGLGYGGGMQIQSVGSAKLDGVSLKNGYLAYSLRGFVIIGNIHMLENQAIIRPWEVRILAEKNFIGSNAPDAQTLSIKLSTYF